MPLLSESDIFRSGQSAVHRGKMVLRGERLSVDGPECCAIDRFRIWTQPFAISWKVAGASPRRQSNAPLPQIENSHPS